MTVVAEHQTLEERIRARLHEQIGDLITEDDLKGIVARGIEHALFEPRLKEVSGSYSTKYDHTPSIVDTLVRELLERRMAAEVEGWLRANPERLERAIDEAVAKGAGACMIGFLDARMAAVFDNAFHNLKNQGLLPRGPNG